VELLAYLAGLRLLVYIYGLTIVVVLSSLYIVHTSCLFYIYTHTGGWGRVWETKRVDGGLKWSEWLGGREGGREGVE
jgi:hypothetical protein